MSRVLVVLALVSAVVAVSARVTLSPSDLDLYDQFTAFEHRYSRHYSSSTERLARFETFKSNMNLAAELTSLTKGAAQFGATKFADLTPDEFATRVLMTNYTRPHPPPENIAGRLQGTAVPAQFDWRTMNMVSPVQDQGECGACWAFATTSEVESLWRIAGDSPDIQFSAQQLVDCDTYDNGCAGGSASNAFMYIAASGLTLMNQYPYAGAQQTCQYNAAVAQPAITSAATQTPGATPQAILGYVYQHGPTTAVIDATKLQFYQGGVISLPSSYCPNLNHMVLLVGYDSDAGFFIGKNSWGANWGEQGFFRMDFQSCMINTEVVGSAAAA